MNTVWLRSLIRKYGDLGVLLVAACLGFYHLWIRRRALLVAILTPSIFFLLLWPPLAQHHRPARHASPPALSFATRPPALSADDLLDRATRVTSTTEWDLPNGTDAQSYMTYYWPTNHKVLFFRQGQNIGELLWERNLTTGTETPFRKVSAWWSEDGNFKKQIELSPDGKWVLWEGDYYEHSYSGYYGASREGNRKFHFRRHGWPQVTFLHWLPDSRHFLESTARYNERTGQYIPLRTVMRNVESPQVALEPPYPRAVVGQMMEAYSDWQCHPIRDKRVILVKSFPTEAWPPHSYVLKEIILGRKIKLLHHWRIAIPAQESRDEMAISPDGDLIAWIIVTLIGSAQQESARRVAKLCISRIDGSHLHEVGQLSMSVGEAYESPDFMIIPHELKWLPDGKRLSFLYKDVLYTVPAD